MTKLDSKITTFDTGKSGETDTHEEIINEVIHSLKIKNSTVIHKLPEANKIPLTYWRMYSQKLLEEFTKEEIKKKLSIYLEGSDECVTEKELLNRYTYVLASVKRTPETEKKVRALYEEGVEHEDCELYNVIFTRKNIYITETWRQGFQITEEHEEIVNELKKHDNMSVEETIFLADVKACLMKKDITEILSFILV